MRSSMSVDKRIRHWIKDHAEEDVMLVKTHAFKIVIMLIVKGIIHAVVKIISQT